MVLGSYISYWQTAPVGKLTFLGLRFPPLENGEDIIQSYDCFTANVYVKRIDSLGAG